MYKYQLACFILIFSSAVAFANQKETYKDIILKAQNLSLQRDRVQACQILTRSMQKESKQQSAYQELRSSLEQLSTVFYTEKAQALYSQSESLFETKPKDSIEKLQEALKLEEGNLTILKTLVRDYIKINDCSSAETYQKNIENFDKLTPEVNLLKLQVQACSKNWSAVELILQNKDLDWTGVEKYMYVYQLNLSLDKKDFKKAKVIMAQWESSSPDYVEQNYWKDQILCLQEQGDKPSLQKYIQNCKNMSTRKKKSYFLDVDLCQKLSESEQRMTNLSLKKEELK